MKPEFEAARRPTRRLLRIAGLALVLLTCLALALHGRRAWSAWQDWKLGRLTLPQLEEAARRDPSDARVAYHLGLVLARSGRTAEATRALIAAAEGAPDRPEVFNDLGVTYLVQDRQYEALVAFQAAITADPKFAPAHANVGRLYLATEMPYSAVRELERSVQLDRRNRDAWTDLGEAYQSILSYGPAERAYRRALALDSRDLLADVGLARTYMATARYADARSVLQTALKQQPEFGPALALLGKVRLETSTSPEDLEAARDLLIHATRLGPRNADAWVDLGLTQLRLQHPSLAVDALQTALNVSPQFAPAMHQMERALRAAGRISEADRMGTQYRRVALLEREQERLEERASRAGNPTWDERVHLAELYLQTGKNRLAYLIARQLQHAEPNHPKLPELLRALSAQASRSAPELPAAGSGSHAPIPRAR